MNEGNPYQSPLVSAQLAQQGLSAWRFVPTGIALFLGGLHLLLWALNLLSVAMGTNRSMSPIGEFIAGILMFGGCGAGWLLAAWLWFRARYVWATIVSALSCATIGLFVAMFAFVLLSI
ncbi:MAG: hypothetical protein SGJ19_26475 [Planctomycetia bacterium]|nr:hypothetical protein [Planctomycetia bacterium]